MISELTIISELSFTVDPDGTPRVAMRYAGCDLLVVDDDGDTWFMDVSPIDCEIVSRYPATTDAGTIAAVIRGAKGFVAVRAK